MTPDDLIRRWYARQEDRMIPKTALVWELPGDDSDDPAALLIRPHQGDVLLSLSTRRTALLTLARRPITYAAIDPTYQVLREPDSEGR